jgi:Zn-finger protein
MLKEECGGDYVMTNGIKDCSNCTKPHEPGGYEYIMSKMKLVIERGSNF